MEHISQKIIWFKECTITVWWEGSRMDLICLRHLPLVSAGELQDKGACHVPSFFILFFWITCPHILHYWLNSTRARLFSILQYFHQLFGFVLI
jgi:hypothetical protein